MLLSTHSVPHNLSLISSKSKLLHVFHFQSGFVCLCRITIPLSNIYCIFLYVFVSVFQSFSLVIFIIMYFSEKTVCVFVCGSRVRVCEAHTHTLSFSLSLTLSPFPFPISVAGYITNYSLYHFFLALTSSISHLEELLNTSQPLTPSSPDASRSVKCPPNPPSSCTSCKQRQKDNPKTIGKTTHQKWPQTSKSTLSANAKYLPFGQHIYRGVLSNATNDTRLGKVFSPIKSNNWSPVASPDLKQRMFKSFYSSFTHVSITTGRILRVPSFD